MEGRIKYVWIWILVILYAFWLILSIMDITRKVKYVKKYILYNGMYDFIGHVIGGLEIYTVEFVVLHIFVLFIVSLIIWIRTGGVS